MNTMAADCSECGRKRLCVLLQVCVPLDDVDLPHEKILDIHICRECVAKMGSMGLWIEDAARSYYARQKS